MRSVTNTSSPHTETHSTCDQSLILVVIILKHTQHAVSDRFLLTYSGWNWCYALCMDPSHFNYTAELLSVVAVVILSSQKLDRTTHIVHYVIRMQ